jgi:hypothetical protein
MGRAQSGQRGLKLDAKSMDLGVVLQLRQSAMQRLRPTAG